MSQFAIVTGAAHGMGQAIALRLVNEGYIVVAVDLDEEGLDQLEQKTGDKSLIKKNGDVGDSTFIKQMLSEIDSSRLRLLVNNAGVRWATSILHSTDEEWETTLRVNLSGPFYFMRETGRVMAETESECLIINVASVAGLVGFNNRASYCASKGGLVMLTKAAAMDLAPNNIRVVAICPGFVNTNMTEDHAHTLVDKHVPLGKSGSPNDIAQAVVDLTQWPVATGSAIVLDSGLTAGFRW
ncbi:SDR family NAD(P)-dependent oxidoreductase [Alteribacillus sp. YIM 98480]|uniref:SDR family NAD(P)-dependent oxidoreductase n=1 Tax=Alteribacillus sp. YIM 98480 TaxID=2606599 RepID=UPI00131B5272|nr:SDR family oxidoreductase [Alteribacillus sp. YIM 98480]